MGKRKRVFLDELIDAMRRARKDGMTRYRISKLTGIDQANLCKIVQGRTVPKVDTAERIAEAIGYKIALTKR